MIGRVREENRAWASTSELTLALFSPPKDLLGFACEVPRGSARWEPQDGKHQYSSALQGVGVREWEGVGVEGWVEPQGAERLLRAGSHLMSLYQGTLSLHP